MFYSDAALLRQLSSNSQPYRDPLVLIEWDRLSLDEPWLPEQALSLYGLPEYATVSDTIKLRLSHYEFVNVMLCGLWLESLFLQGFARCLGPALERGEHEYLLHEVREEAGHSLMFLKAIEASGLPLPEDAWRAPRLSNLLSSNLPLDGTLFWLAAVIGEEVPDKFNRFIRQSAQQVNATIRQILSVHIIDEARHIALARGRLETRLRQCGSVQRAVLACAARLLLRQLIGVFCFPPAQFYELAGLSRGRSWRHLARNSPTRREFVAQCLAPTRRMLQGYGLDVGL